MVQVNNFRFCTFNGKLLTIDVPAHARQSVQLLYDNCKKNKGGYFRGKLETPKKPRTTGKRSQNNNVRGTARQIHNHCGQGIDSIIEYAACKAADEGIISFRKDENGCIIYNSWGVAMGTSESTWSTVEAAGVIQILIGMATDMGIVLKERGE